MAAITQRITNFLGGVSRQPDSKKLNGQVREAINVYPEPGQGLIKRSGFKFLDALHNDQGFGIPFGDYTTPYFDNAKWFFIDRDDDEFYIGCVKGRPIGSFPGGEIFIWNATPDSNGNYVKCFVSHATNSRDYLDATNESDYDLLTVQDTTIVVNKTKVVAEQPAGTAQSSNVGTIIIKAVEYSATYNVVINGTTYSYQTYNADNFTNDSGTDTKLNADTILAGLQSAINAAGISGMTTKRGKNILELTSTSSFTLDTSGGVSGTSIRSFQDEVDNVTDLPATAAHGRIVKIVNSNSAAGTYYAQFVASNTTGIGDGYWEETRAPGVSAGLDANSMPHQLVNTGLNTFTFGPITYEDRLAGDAETNSNPSFVGKTINGAFFHSNRLGFLSGENVSMSQAGDFFNFFFTTATAVTAADPVDLACSSIRPLTLHSALPSAGGLVLFSQSQQFLLYSQSGSLTPQDSVITGLSNYETDKNIPPVEVGTSLFFVSKTPSWSRVFSFTTRGNQEPPQVLDMSQAISQYIPSTVTQLISSAQNSFVALYGETDRNVYFYKFFNNGQSQVMQAWFKWELPGYPLLLTVGQDVVYAIIQAGNKYMLCQQSISSSTDEALLFSSDGNTIAPFIDFYAPAASVTSFNNGSRIDLPYEDIDGLDPVILVKGNDVDFNNITESGFTAHVEKVTSGGTTFFFVEGRDLSSQASDVIVGYKYAYDVHLPTFYYQPSPDHSRPDYRAYLIINRLTFSCGEVGSFGLKVRAKGVRGRTFTFTGDGTTTEFPLTFKPDDRRDVAVLINDDVAFNFTIDDDGVITFSTAPANGDTIVAFEDYVYVNESSVVLDEYLADDVAIKDQTLHTFPVNHRNQNVEIRVYSDAPFPISLSSLVWEGQYSPRFIRRA